MVPESARRCRDRHRLGHRPVTLHTVMPMRRLCVGGSMYSQAHASPMEKTPERSGRAWLGTKANHEKWGAPNPEDGMPVEVWVRAPGTGADGKTSRTLRRMGQITWKVHVGDGCRAALSRPTCVSWCLGVPVPRGLDLPGPP